MPATTDKIPKVFILYFYFRSTNPKIIDICTLASDKRGIQFSFNKSILKCNTGKLNLEKFISGGHFLIIFCYLDLASDINLGKG